MSIRLDLGTIDRLEALAQGTERSKAWLAAQAVKTYLDVNEWQIQAIREGLKRADRKDARFFTNEAVDTWLASWGTPKERKPPL